jgi:hypothetical protein
MARDRPPVLTTLRDAEDLTPEVLTELLQEAAPGVVVRDVAVQSVHQGSASHIHLQVSYDGDSAGLPPHLFVKTQIGSTVEQLPTDYGDAFTSGGLVTMSANETFFYQRVRPLLDVETVRVLKATLLPGPSQFLLVCEDLNDRGASFPDPGATATVDHALGLVRTLARLHATLWNTPRFGSEGDLAWVQTPVKGEFADFLRTDTYRENMLRGAIRDVPYKRALLEACHVDIDTMEDAFWRLLDAQDQAPTTILHGDTHPGNVYVLPDGTVGLLDWQLLRRGSWVHDVAYGFISALDPEDRRAHEQDLLREYFDELGRLGVEQLPSWDDVWRLYRMSPSWGWAMWVVTPDVMYSPATVEAVIDRFAQAFRDLDTRAAVGL